MAKYDNLFLISPGLFVSEIEKDVNKMEKDIDEIRARQNQLEETIISVRRLADGVLESRVRDMSNPAPFVQKWYYDARFPSYTLDNVYELEGKNGIFWRWTGPERFVKFSLLLDRSTQYVLVAKVLHFISEEARKLFVLMVNDEEIPWIQESDTSYKAVVPGDPGLNASETTRILIGCGEASRVPAEGDDRTLWFSLSSIDVQVF
jgi:hypothetical protein